jgi:hypothetical protein
MGATSVTELAVVVPWRPGDPHRERAKAYVEGHIMATLDAAGWDAELIEVDDPGERFNRGRALHVGTEAVDARLYAFCDCDLWVPAWAILSALAMAEDGRVVVPFDRLIALGETATERVYRGAAPDGLWDAEDVAMRWDRPSSGGMNVLLADTYRTAGGFDPRLSGWGFEDACFHAAHDTLVGPLRRVHQRAVHLFHPPDPTRHDPATYKANLELTRRYEKAAGCPDMMRALIGER